MPIQQGVCCTSLASQTIPNKGWRRGEGRNLQRWDEYLNTRYIQMLAKIRICFAYLNICSLLFYMHKSSILLYQINLHSGTWQIDRLQPKSPTRANRFFSGTVYHQLISAFGLQAELLLPPQIYSAAWVQLEPSPNICFINRFRNHNVCITSLHISVCCTSLTSQTIPNKGWRREVGGTVQKTLLLVSLLACGIGPIR